MELRRATPADAALLAYWDTKPHVIAATGDDDVEDWERELPREVPWREYLIGEEDGRPIGFVAIIDAREEESHYWGDAEPNLRAIDIWLGEEADLGQGYGSAMMRLAIEHCFADQDVTAILIDPLTTNTGAQRFYARHGFSVVGPRRFGDDDCTVMRLGRPSPG